jgi:hypothetical protein
MVSTSLTTMHSYGTRIQWKILSCPHHCLVTLVNVWTTSGYKIETTYFYYIIMKIYVFFAQIFTHIFVFMYNYYVINIFPTMDFTHSQIMPKLWRSIFQFFSTILFYKTFNFLQQVVLLKWSCLQTPQYILRKFLKSYTSHNSSCNSTGIFICNTIYLTNHYLWVMHIHL